MMYSISLMFVSHILVRTSNLPLPCSVRYYSLFNHSNKFTRGVQVLKFFTI
jgi:hypothetical protein